MRHGWKFAAIGFCMATWIATPAAAAPAAPSCDEYNPFGPARIGEIALNATDFADEHGTELLSFIETESIGPVEAQLVRKPGEHCAGHFGCAGHQHGSPYFGERLKGIRVAVSLNEPRQPVRVVLKLRQVCAKHFRNTFLYY